MTSPTQLTLERLREDGYHPEVCERWIPGARIRKDLWGFTDVLAIREEQILAVQCTSLSNVASRIRKIEASPLLGLIRKAGIAIEVWGWSKKDGEWRLRKVDLS